MSDLEYEKALEDVARRDKKIISSFERFLIDQGLSKKTISSHCSNIDFFTHYLNYYGDNECMKTLADADSADISEFLGSWFPRKAMWSSPGYVKSYISSFKKFFAFLLSEELIQKDTLNEIKNTIREEKDEWISANSF